MVQPLDELANLVGGEVRGDRELPIHGVLPLQTATKEHLSFLTNGRYAKLAQASQAGALLVGPELAPALEGRNLLVVADPYVALAKIVPHFAPPPTARQGISRDASVDPSAEVAPSAYIDAGARIGEEAVIGAGSWIGANATVGKGASIGQDCILEPGSHVLEGCSLHDRVRLGAGTVIGSQGFGFATDKAGVHHKIPQLGTAVVEDDVEIGACCTVDRATFGETRVGAGTKIDNLVQIAHNVEIGRGCLLVSQAGIAGSTTLEDHVIIGPQAGVVGHIRVGAGARVAGQSGVVRALDPGKTYAGSPAQEFKKWTQSMAILQRLPLWKKKLLKLMEGVDD